MGTNDSRIIRTFVKKCKKPSNLKKEQRPMNNCEIYAKARLYIRAGPKASEK